MATPFIEYLKKHPELTDLPPDAVLEHMYGLNEGGESFDQFSDRMFTDPDDREKAMREALQRTHRIKPPEPKLPKEEDKLSDPDDPSNQFVEVPGYVPPIAKEKIPEARKPTSDEPEPYRSQDVTAQPYVKELQKGATDIVSQATELATGIPVDKMRAGAAGKLTDTEAADTYIEEVTAGIGLGLGAVASKFMKTLRPGGEKIPIPGWLTGAEWRNKLTADYRDILRATKEQMDTVAAGIKKAEEAYDFETVGALQGELTNLTDYWKRISAEKPPIPGDPIMSKVHPHPKGPESAVIGGAGRQYTGKIDALHAINKAVKMATGSYSGKHKLPENMDPYVLSRLMAGNLGRFEHAMKYGAFEFGTTKETGPGLRAIVNPVRSRLDEAMRYAIAKRTLESESQGYATGMPLDVAKMTVETVESRAAYEPDYQKFIKFQQQWSGFSRNWVKYLVDAGVYSQEQADRFTAQNMFYIPAHRLMPEYEGAVRVGSKGSPKGGTQPIHAREGSELDWLDPLESTVRNTQAFIQIAERNNVYFWLSRLAKTYELPQIAEQVERSAVRPIEVSDSELTGFLKDYGIDQKSADTLTIFRPNFWRPSPNEFAVMVDGKKEIWRADPAIIDALGSVDRQSVNDMVKLMAIPAKLLRAGATRSPDFPLANWFRDQFSAMWNTNYNYLSTDIWRAVADLALADRSQAPAFMEWLKNPAIGNKLVEPGPRFKEAMRAGALNSNVVSLDEMRADMARHGVMPMTSGEVAKWWATSPLTALQLWSNMTEYATRLSGYIKARSTGASPQAAAYEWRELTVDFARNGAQMQAWNMIVAFQNAQIQGVDRAVRGAISNPARAATVATFGNFLPALYLWQANHDDPRYKNLEDYVRHNNFIFLQDDWQAIPQQLVNQGWKPFVEPTTPEQKSEMERLKRLYPTRTGEDGKLQYNDGPLANYFQSYRIRPKTSDVNGAWEANMGAVVKLPMAWEIGVTFASAPIAALNKYVANNPQASHGITNALIQAYAPGLLPNALVAAGEVVGDYSLFLGRKITPRALMDEEPKYRYTTYTSETAKKISNLFDKMGASNDITTPIHIDYLVRAWTGSLGTYATQLSDWTLRKLGQAPPPAMAQGRWSEMPGIRRFLANSPSYAAAPISQFYEDYIDMQQKMRSYKRRVERGEMEAADEIQASRGFARVEPYARALSALRREIGVQQRMPLRPDNEAARPDDVRMTAREKTALLEEYYRQSIVIAKQASSLMEAGKSKIPGPKSRTKAMDVKDEVMRVFANLNNADQEILLNRKDETQRWNYVPYARKDLQERYVRQWRDLPDEKKDQILEQMPTNSRMWLENLPAEWGSKKSRSKRPPPPSPYKMEDIGKPDDRPPPPASEGEGWIKKFLQENK